MMVVDSAGVTIAVAVHSQGPTVAARAALTRLAIRQKEIELQDLRERLNAEEITHSCLIWEFWGENFHRRPDQ